jgi:hypothetical protein
MDQVTIHTGDLIHGNLTLKIFNTAGQKVMDQEIHFHGKADQCIDLSSLFPSLYFYTLAENGAVLYEGKLIKN